MKIRHLPSVAEVIDAIGRERLMQITGKRSNNLWNWQASGYFPPETFVVVSDELRHLRCTAPPSLWRMIAKPKARAA